MNYDTEIAEIRAEYGWARSAILLTQPCQAREDALRALARAQENIELLCFETCFGGEQ